MNVINEIVNKLKAMIIDFKHKDSANATLYNEYCVNGWWQNSCVDEYLKSIKPAFIYV